MEALTNHRSGSMLRQSFNVTVLLMGLLPVLPEYYFLLNIAVVVLIGFQYLMFYKMHASVLCVLTVMYVLLQILLTQDVARVSLLVFYFFLNTKCLYDRGAVKRYMIIYGAVLGCTLLAYALFDFRVEYDRMSWSFTEKTFYFERGLGFINPNRCMLYVFCLSCVVLSQAKRIWQYLCVLAVNGVFFYFTGSRTFWYVIIFLTVGLLLLRTLHREDRCEVPGGWIPVIFLALLALSVVLPLYCSDTWLNELFSRRLVHNRTFMESGISLLGNGALESESFDSAYLHMLLAKGVTYLAGYLIIFICRCHKAMISNKNALIMTAILLTGFMEVIFLEYGIMYLFGLLLSGGEREGTA